MNETLYNSSYLIGVEEVLSRDNHKNGKLRNITFLALLAECGCLKGLSQSEIDSIKELTVVWKQDEKFGDIDIESVYDNDKGTILWSNEYACADWTDNDEKLVCSLLMWANVESKIGEMY
tara:strand:+ start:2136 stop:2495 length:360 start_codon:yes stop_codon:yes gene_type:complete